MNLEIENSMPVLRRLVREIPLSQKFELAGWALLAAAIQIFAHMAALS